MEADRRRIRGLEARSARTKGALLALTRIASRPKTAPGFLKLPTSSRFLASDADDREALSFKILA